MATCDDCTKGQTPPTTSGSVTIGGIECVVVRPSKQTTKAVPILTDVMGIRVVAAQKLAEKFANEGFIAVLPDTLKNDPISMSPTVTPEERAVFMKSVMPGWMAKHPHEEMATMVHSVISDLQEKEGIKSFAVSGYCWGGRLAILVGASDDIKCYICSHPSAPKIPTDFENVRKPGLYVCAETDQSFGDDIRHQAQEILKTKQDKFESKFIMYPGVTHGFAMRGDESDPVIKVQKEKAFRDTVDFLNQYL